MANEIKYLTVNLTSNEINELKNSFDTILPIKGTGLTFEISENLQNIEKAITSIKAIAKDITEKYIIKDAEGKKQKFAVDYVGDQYFYKRKEGKFVKVSEEEEGEFMIDTQNEEYQNDNKIFSEKTFELKLNTISRDNLKALSAEGKPFDGVNIVPLLKNFVWQE